MSADDVYGPEPNKSEWWRRVEEAAASAPEQPYSHAKVKELEQQLQSAQAEVERLNALVNDLYKQMSRI